MHYETVATHLLTSLGGAENLASLINCITRLRIEFRDESKVNRQQLERMTEIIQLVWQENNGVHIVLGPGHAQRVREVMTSLIEQEKKADSKNPSHKKHDISMHMQYAFKKISAIFIPILPSVIFIGVLSTIISLLFGGRSEVSLGSNDIIIMDAFYSSFFTAMISILIAFYATKDFGGTPVMGVLLTFFLIQMYMTKENPVFSGVLTVLMMSFVLSRLEILIRNYMPSSLDLAFTNLISFTLTTIITLLVLVPIAKGVGFIFSNVMMLTVYSSIPLIRVMVGFTAAALFLPMIMRGYHHIMVIIYLLEMQYFQSISLFMVLAMAGASQIGMALALMHKARQVKNWDFITTTKKSIFSALLGAGESLMYRITSPLKEHVTWMIGIGAGFGGAWILLNQVQANSWGLSGFFALLFIPNWSSMGLYLVGYGVSILMGFIVTMIFAKRWLVRE
ncbi:PTS transporter subunit EIIB [Entomospira entomophila]|uniref:PTS system N-acetylmuramic acid-specific EIIBC component n=1 Tax=Entomospira entomophila TaxID=2719988 RepID=A0A968KRQ1_9SPIO|nr:PTS transporter subunit EIIB [Entomospira entomophilus]NIZ40964.1 PTS transporter subunit EIIB [Entomospira entomophilus]WDI35177.1 PTS transporter subunit EIIB [Entomospira entomophilus]